MRFLIPPNGDTVLCNTHTQKHSPEGHSIPLKPQKGQTCWFYALSTVRPQHTRKHYPYELSEKQKAERKYYKHMSRLRKYTTEIQDHEIPRSSSSVKITPSFIALVYFFIKGDNLSNFLFLSADRSIYKAPGIKSIEITKDTTIDELYSKLANSGPLIVCGMFHTLVFRCEIPIMHDVLSKKVKSVYRAEDRDYNNDYDVGHVVTIVGVTKSTNRIAYRDPNLPQHLIDTDFSCFMNRLRGFIVESPERSNIAFYRQPQIGDQMQDDLGIDEPCCKLSR